MNITHILADLRQRNITVRMKGNDLSVVAEKGVLSPEIRATLVNHKQAIVSYLRQLKQGETAQIQVVDRGAQLPLSFGQQRLWFLAQLEPDSASYIIPAAVRIFGPLQPAILKQALEQVIQRHEVLRTVFKTEDEHPRQVILDQMAAPFAVVDLRQDSAADQDTKLQQCIRRELEQPFDLSAGPLLRATLLQVAEQEHVLLLALHHIVADGWSIAILVRELSAFYASAQAGGAAELPTLSVQYADYAAWQHRWNESPARGRQLEYWEKQLAELVPLALPTDHPRNDHRSPRGATTAFVIPNKLAERLRLLGLEEEATPFMVLLAAFKVLLSRYCGQNQVAVGTPVANRERREIEGLIGFFVNTLVLSSEVNGACSFRDFLRQVRKSTLDALENQDLPFEQLVDHLQPTRNLNQNPLFQVMFIMQNMPRSELRLGDVSLQPFNVDTQSAKFDLTLSLSPEADQLQGWLSYNAELFEPATVERMIAHYRGLLEGIVEQPEQSVAELPLLTETERRQLLVEWNQTAAQYAAKFVHSLFEEQAAANPGAVAVEYEGQQLSYGELNARANQLARYLREQGVGPEIRVGIYASRSLEMIVGIIGILKSGGAYVPLEPSYPAERLAYMAQDARLELLLTQAALKEQAVKYGVKVVCLDKGPDVENLERHSRTNLEPVSLPGNLAYVIYTSGSTGQPKGVAVSHDNLLHSTLARWSSYDKPVSRYLLLSSIAFDSSVAGVFWTLGQGGALCLPDGTGQYDLENLAQQIMQRKVSHLLCIPSLYGALLREGPEGFAASLQAAIVAGESCPSELVHRHEEQAPQAILYNEYGPTEASVWCTVYKHQANQLRSAVPIGKPIANAQVYVLDNYMQPVPAGVAGELFVGGSGITRGYLNRPELTAEKFFPDPFSGMKGTRLYRTGDRVRYLSDGALEYLGRIDAQVKIRGYRIELDEIEAVLRENPKVEECVVTIHVDHREEKRLVAYFVSSGSEGVNADELRNALKTRLPEYMVPAYFIALEKMPLTPNGKLDRKALPEPEYQAGKEQVAPRTVEEEILCGIFASVLKLDQVGVTQNFFDIGGHSLLATQVISRIRAAFDVALPLRALFESPTVAELAERIERERGLARFSAPALLPVPRDQAIPLSFAQQRLWFLDQLNPNSPTYNSSVGLRLQGELNREALEWAFSEIVRRHEALRTHFAVLQGRPRQVIGEASAIEIPVIDLSATTSEEREAEIKKAMKEEAEMPFDLTRSPLLRIKLLRRDELDHVLLMTVHHINSDGWSEGIMVREFSQLYEAHVLGRPSPLPELDIQYPDYAVWQREWLQGAVLDSQITYWRNQLAEAPVLEMPTDYSRAAARKSEAGTSLKWELPEEISRDLKELGRREGATLFMTLLATFQLLLSRHSGQKDIATGSPIAGRTRTEIEPLIGFFVNTLVLRTDLSGAPTFRELLRRVRETTLTAYAHQDVPFEKLVEELQPGRDLGRSPLFQAMFMLQNAPTAELQLPGLKLSVMDRAAETVHFELLLSASEEKNGKISGGLSFRTNLFHEESIRRLLGHWQNLLASAAGNPEKRIGELEMLAEAERRQVIEEFNRTDAQFRDLLVHEMVEEQAAKDPAAIAVKFGTQRLSFGDLNRRANQLAHYLRKRGARPEVLVGISVERSLEMMIGVLAILKTGAAYVPLDPKYPPARLSYMLENSQIDLLVTKKQFLSIFSGLVKSTICFDSDSDAIALESESNLNVAADRDNVAFVIYTSGSTGQPKGVAYPHGPSANLVGWHLLQGAGAPPPTTLQFASLSFDVSFQEIFATLCAGGCLVFIGEDERRDPAELWRVMCDQQVTRVSLPFVSLDQLVEAALKSGRKATGLRELISAGEQLRITPSLQKLLSELPMCRLENQCGPSESHVVTVCYLDEDPQKWPPLPPIGKPRANSQIYLLNEEFQPVPIRVAGELYLSGRQVSRGYVGRPDLTAERYLPNPFSKEPGGRLYRTGDLARYLEDGSIEYLGRMDHQVKVRGYRIELGEVESALSKCEAVEQAVAVIREDRPGQKRLVGYVVGQDGREIKEGNLRNELKQRLPEFMVPAVFVVLERLPLTPSGKVDRRRLPDPGRGALESEANYVAPRNLTEEILCGIWEELLKRDRIGVDQNFFELGGHSLLATQVVARVSDALQLELPVRRLFEAPTVAELARVIVEEKAVGSAERIPAMARAARNGAIPVSFAQQRLWFLDQLQPGMATYNLPVALRLSGAVQVELLEQAFTDLFNRHEALRTTFNAQDGEAIQVIAPASAVYLPVTDLSWLPADTAQEEARRLAEQEAETPFDLAHGPLVRIKLLRLSEQDHVLLVTMHHIISDGWSLGIMVREFSQFYQARCKGEASGLAELPIQYADFSIWQREWLQGAVLERELGYWKERLSVVQALELATDRPRPAVMSYAGGSAGFRVGREELEALKRLSRQKGTTLYMTCLAAWQALLYRYSGQEDIAVGSPIAGRRWTETEGLIGFFVNTLVLRSAVKGEQRFVELLQQVREVTLEAYMHQDVPFEKVVEELEPERDLSRTPLFQVMFMLQNTPKFEMELGEVRLAPFNVEGQTAKFDLTLAIAEEKEGLEGWLSYNRDLYDAGTMERMLEHYGTMLKGIGKRAEEAIGELPLLPEAERQQLLVEWNQTAAEYPKKTIAELFEEQAERTPQAVAVEYEGQQLSYAELNARTNQLGAYLRKLGVGPEVRAGICMERSLEMVVGILGILKAGGAYVPLDSNYPQERLDYMFEDSGLEVLLIGTGLEEKITASPSVRVVALNREWEKVAEESTSNLKVSTHPEHLAYVMYTSGSTGKPKGIGIPHCAVVRLVKESNYAELGTQEVFLQMAPVSFDASTLELWGSLLNGGKLVVMQAGLPSLESLARVLQREKISTLWLTAGIFHAMVEDQVESLRGVRQVLAGGDVLSPAHVEKFLAGGEKNRRLINGYGPTENTTFTCCHVMEEYKADGRTVAIGRPITNTQVYVLDKNMNPAPIGVIGELYIGGDGLARGYLGRPELTAEKFVPDPFSQSEGARLYRSGDLCRWRESGEIEFAGRRDQQVKIRGYRIELGEIENVLTEHPEIAQAAVIAQDERGGGKRLVAYFVAASGNTIRGSDLRNYLKERLPEYMVPALFVEMAQLPLTSNGKLDRKALPSPELGEDENKQVEPRNATEEILCGIWSQVLGVERLGIEDNFFELGGHSLLATQLVSRVRKIFSVELPLRILFERPTIAGVAEAIEQARLTATQNGMPPIKKADRSQPLPLSLTQQRLWFIDQLEPGNSAYNAPLALRILGRLDKEALHWAVQDMVRRQEVLRTRFPQRDGVPIQEIQPEMEVNIEEIVLAGLNEGERERKAARVATEEGLRPFDLAHGPLVRIKLLRLSDQDHVLLVTMHHIISDGWSLSIMVREFSQFYQARCKGEASGLAELPIQYADFSIWQREWLQGAVLERELGYWKERLSGVQALELATDRPRPAVMSYAGGSAGFRVGREELEALKRLSRQKGTTLYMTCLAAWQALLYRYSGQEDIAVGSPIAGRRWTETEGLIGFFVNTLVLRSAVKGEQRFVELLQQVREVTLEAYMHQDVPFEKVVEELEPERDLSRTPLFQVMFMLQNTPKFEMELGEVRLAPFNVEGQTAKFDLTLAIAEEKEGLEGWLSYNRDLYDAGTMERMLEHYGTMLKGIGKRAEEAIGELLLLPEAERQQLLVEWNQTGRRYVQVSCMHKLFEDQVQRTPHEIALEYDGQQLTYTELNLRANQLAAYLRNLGVGPEVLVGICMERNLGMIIGLLGILKSGGAYVPLDPQYPQERLSYMLSDADARVVLTQKKIKERVQGLGAGKVLCWEDVQDEIQLEQGSNPEIKNDGENAAYLIYTSGSTGQPKATTIRHSSAVTLLNWAQEVYCREELEAVLASTSICFDLSVFEIFVPLSCGGRIVLVENALDLPRLQKAGKVTLINTVPSAMRELLRMNGVPRSVSTVNLAGEALKRDLVNDIYRQTTVQRVVNLYGPSEDTTYSTYVDLNAGEQGTVMIGRPVANTQVYVLDSERRPAPIGVPGEIYIGGSGLGRGYWNRPHLTAEKFVPNPFSNEPGQRLYRTGDKACWRSDGNLDYLGRLDDQVKIRGHRIELGEIEVVLAQHETVAQAVAIAKEDQPGDKRLVAYVVPRGEATINSKTLRTYLRSRLPEYMAPGTIVELQALPLNSNGKIDRRSLAKFSATEQRDEKTYVAPRTVREEMLANIWAELLRVERVGIYDSFFELGGHSLLVIQALARMRNSLGLEVPVRALFEEPTIAGLVNRLREGSTSVFAPPPISRCARERRIPLSFAQQRLWFLDQLEPGNRVYHIPVLLRLNGELNIDAFSAALNEIVRRHEVLRTGFPAADGQPYQMISLPAPVLIEKIDLHDVLPESREESLRTLTDWEVQKPFDLARGPLFRVVLYTLGERQHVLCLTAHHIICDALSVPIFVRELRVLYNAFLNGSASPLPELPLQYADVAVWEQEWLRDDALEREVQYWRQKLDGCAQTLELPTDFPRPSVQSFEAEMRSLTLSPELSRALTKLGQSLGATEFMTVLALMNVWLFRYSGQSDILVGTPVSNRNQLETEQLIGFFLNTLVFRTRVDANVRFAALVNQVRSNALDAYDHQALPFEKLVDELQVVRDPGRNPLFQVMFNMGSELTEKLEFAGMMEGEAIPPNSIQARFDIHLNARPMRTGLELTITYNCGLFQPATITSMLESFAELVRLVVENPEVSISDLVAKVVRFEQESTLARKRGHSLEQGQQLRLARRRAALSESN